MKRSDVIVVGAGISGLMAGITMAATGASVTVLSQGAGVLSIGSGAVDFLGYDNGKRITDNPFDHLPNLPKNHPYNIVGKECIKEAFREFMLLCGESGLELNISPDGKNKIVASVMGTLRPTYISSNASDAKDIFNAKKIAVVSVEWLKDCEPGLAVTQLKLYPKLANKNFSTEILKSPFGKTHRSINCLDIARYVDKTEGFLWLQNELMRIKDNYDFMLIPPILGVTRHMAIFTKLHSLGLNLVEMASIPPGVGGFRIRSALYQAAKRLNIEFVENCFVSRAKTDGRKCASLIALHNDIAGALETEYFAEDFIIATGGILGGGIVTAPGKVKEAIFGIDIECPPMVEEWSYSDVFDSHPFVSFGVSVSNRMRPINKSGSELFSNVYFAGRTISGYDFAKEKSGYGVALATARRAALGIIEKGKF